MGDITQKAYLPILSCEKNWTLKEKPLAATIEEAEKLVELSVKTGRKYDIT
nr:hypothetical protein [Aneurinibacillus terranovensis]